NRNFEFYWFPHTSTTQIKTMNAHPIELCGKKNQVSHFLKDIVVENGLFKMMSETSRVIPQTSKSISALSALGVPVGKKHGYSHHIFATPRLVKFQEMEYGIPVEAMEDAIRDIKHCIEKYK